MNKMPFVSILFILLAGVCFVIFLMFNYAYYNSNNGLFNILDDHASDDMTTDNYNFFDTVNSHVKTGIGFAGVFMLALGLITALASGFNKTEIE